MLGRELKSRMAQVPRLFDRYWIGLQRSVHGAYHWKTGEPLREFAWHPRTDYMHNAGTLFIDRYSNWSGLTMRYSLEDPNQKLPSICQAPLITGIPWLRVELRDSGQRMELRCRVSAEIIPGSILWYKDGIAVQGDRASTGDNHNTTLVFQRPTPANPYLQGYYWCEGMSVPDFLPVESKKTLVRFPAHDETHIPFEACFPVGQLERQSHPLHLNKVPLEAADDFVPSQ
ncbi:hypothetical protein HPB50_023307 [Hyalomma asiaticum]|uniref:Uncharacterized protein n=1 Tax=Hyalomma asiaticum TaxID=266040 RepID=A0ACB7TM64_HYAAI|nr:hypothetical protein HPB50_023307 [Hyalomma asiaticum]